LTSTTTMRSRRRRTALTSVLNSSSAITWGRNGATQRAARTRGQTRCHRERGSRRERALCSGSRPRSSLCWAGTWAARRRRPTPECYSERASRRCRCHHCLPTLRSAESINHSVWFSLSCWSLSGRTATKSLFQRVAVDDEEAVVSAAREAA
jgi:hypothetical protein